MTPRIFVPRNDPPTRLWRWDHRGWSYLFPYWPTDGEANSHPHDLTGLCWDEGIVMIRSHWRFRLWRNDADVFGPLNVVYTSESHNGDGRNTVPDGYDELPIPPADDRTSALADMRRFYDTVIAPDTSSVTFPDTWTDPRVLAWCLKRRHRYYSKVEQAWLPKDDADPTDVRLGYRWRSQRWRLDPRALWLELPDLFYDLYRLVH